MKKNHSFRVINNATSLINDDFIIDPWIYGNLYNNSWSPYPKITYNKNNLKKVKYCFISHLHQDHWDLDTIKYFNKDVNFYLPDLKFNKMIEIQLRKKKFKNIFYCKFGKYTKLSKDYSIAVIPPLNVNALETNKIKKKDDNAVAIDTGLLVKLNFNNSKHIFLTDNSPYDLNDYKKYFNKDDISSLFFPYNGFAQDYPLKYNNFSLKEKKKVSLKMALEKEKYILNFIKYIKPKILVPHSSDFILNQDRDIFLKVHSSIFLNKKKYSKRIQKISKVKTYALYSKDILKYDGKNFSSIIKTSDEDLKIFPKKIRNNFPEFKNINKKTNLEFLLRSSLDSLLVRIKNYKLKIPSMPIIIDIKQAKYLVDFKKNSIIKKKYFSKKNVLILKTTQNIIQSILERKIHINNAMIGCYLNWERHPKSYLKFKDTYNALNFFHN